MIIFEGKLSKKNRRFLLGLYRKSLILSSIFVFICGLLVVLPFYLTLSTIGLIMLVLPPVGLLTELYLLISCICPIKIVLNKNCFLLFKTKQTKNRHSENINFEEVESIEDHGDFYLCITNRKLKFICQKNLLIKGSIDDFEKLFADKLKK